MAKVTRTTNPLPFEHLEPRRFEDLVRQLMYDFRDWQSIEATGHSGNDDGFDIRGHEKLKDVANRVDSEEDEDNEEGKHLLEGNEWMVQCKREKSIGPTKIRKIIVDGVKKDNPPYGYILVAPTIFSKTSYDTFRSELLSRGVSEFYLWGRGELEDMLYMPKNDRILFTFFGISFSSKKRSRSSEIRFVVNNKNKLIKILAGGNPEQIFRKSILVRDYSDTQYKYKDFEKSPRWQEHIAVGIHPEGLKVLFREHYAYIDRDKKEFDFSKNIDLTYRESDQHESEEKRKKNIQAREISQDYWTHLPRKNQVKFVVEGLIPYEDILVIDREGDPWYKFPHIFVDFKGQPHPFIGFWKEIRSGDYHPTIYPDMQGYKRIKIFPETFPKPKKGKIYRNKKIEWPPELEQTFKSGNHITNLYDIGGKYDFLKPRDIILVIKGDDRSDTYYVEITHKFETDVKSYLAEHGPSFMDRAIELQLGRKPQDNEKLTIYEFTKKYGFQVDK